MLMKLLLVRHGETDYNAKKLWIGATDIPLNNAGREQARLLAQRMEKEKIDVIFSSPLKRAKETAEIISARYGKAVVFSDKLRERNFGVYEGTPLGKMREAVENSGLLFHLFRPEAGESDYDVHERVVPFLEKIMREHAGKTVLIVSHGVVIMEMLFYLTKLHRDEWLQLRQSNASLNIIEISDSGDHKVKVINSTEHLL